MLFQEKDDIIFKDERFGATSPPCWATPHPTELRRTLLGYATLLIYAAPMSYAAPYWATPHLTELRCTLLCYAAPYWVTTHPTELCRTLMILFLLFKNLLCNDLYWFIYTFLNCIPITVDLHLYTCWYHIRSWKNSNSFLTDTNILVRSWQAL